MTCGRGWKIDVFLLQIILLTLAVLACVLLVESRSLAKDSEEIMMKIERINEQLPGNVDFNYLRTFLTFHQYRRSSKATWCCFWQTTCWHSREKSSTELSRLFCAIKSEREIWKKYSSIHHWWIWIKIFKLINNSF